MFKREIKGRSGKHYAWRTNFDKIDLKNPPKFVFNVWYKIKDS